MKNDKIAPFPGSDNTSLALITALLTSDQRDQTIAVLKNEMGLYKNYFPVVCAISITFLSFAITALIFTFLKIAATPSSSSLGNSCCIDSCLFDSCSKIACSIILTDQAASEAWLSGRSEQQSYDWAVKQCLKYSSSCDSRMISGNDAGGISILCDTDINKLFSYLGAAALTVVLGCIGTLPIIRGVNKRHFQLLHKLDNKASTDLHRFFKNNANLIPVATPGATAVTIAP
ncbi:MAG: hypothetical protein NTZ67_07275 [Gammaproteobacteria bacterium]|nr:hypothetical protein [Gammaproteobacteria bacterium]